MGLIDFILNVACLLLWLNWRGARFDPLTASKPATLTGTLRRAEPLRFGRWLLPVALLIVLSVRALFYRQLGPAIRWTASLDFGAVSLPFRSDRFSLMTLYSTLSFLHALLICYFWLLFISAVNGNSGAADPFQKLIRLHLGAAVRLPWYVQLLLSILVAALAWMAIHPLLVRAGVSSSTAISHLTLQGLIVGGGLILTLKYLIPAFFLVHLVTSYIFLGRNPFWDFVTLTANNLLAPLRRLPLQIGKVDIAPFVGIGLILLLLHTLPNFVQAWLHRHDRTIWPH